MSRVQYKEMEIAVNTLEAFQNLHCNPSSVIVKCGSDVSAYVRSEPLSTLGQFFESILALKKATTSSLEKTTIDLTGFCSNPISLKTLIYFAELSGTFEFSWDIKSTIDILFLVDPLQLKQAIKLRLITEIEECMTSTVGDFCTHMISTISERNSSEEEILKVIGFLKSIDSICLI